MSRNTFRSLLETTIADFNPDEIRGSVEEVLHSKEKARDVVEQFLRGVNFQGRFRQHPLVWKTIDWGNASREYKKSNAYGKIQSKLTEVLDKQEVKWEDLCELRELLRELRNAVIDFIEGQVGDVKQGLRHIHAPGSVARKEAMNLYFGEKFVDNDLYKLASRLCGSIAFGESIGIYSENEGFMRKMRQFIESLGFGPSFRIERNKLGEIGIQREDENHPYVVLLKFIMWLRNQIDIEKDPEKEKIYLSILNALQSATINMFFMPPNKEKWCTISLPRLDFFINNWIQKDDARKSLEALISNINVFIRAALKESGVRKEVEKVRNMIDLLMNNYEILCRKLIEHGVPDFYAIRNLMNVMVDLSIKYDIKLHFKSLILVL